MNKNAECYYQSALSYYFDARPIPEIDGFEIRLGKKRYFNQGVINCFNDHCSVSIARNKFASNKLLEQAGFPVPLATVIAQTYFENGYLEETIKELQFPLVIKPAQNGRRGRNVLCNIQNLEQLKKHLKASFLDDEFISIEEFHGNLNSYRVLIFKNKLLGVVQRFPAEVTGDSKHTLKELIHLKNIERAKKADILAPIAVDEELHIRLNELGLTLDYIPKRHETIKLCYVCNASRGGTFASLGQRICEENKKLLIKAAKILNLNLVGFDIECKDINLPITSTGGVIIEANANPSIRIHEQPLIGPSQNVSKIILRSLIFKHPLSYLLGLYHHKRTKLYFRVLMFTLVIITCLLLLNGTL